MSEEAQLKDRIADLESEVRVLAAYLQRSLSLLPPGSAKAFTGVGNNAMPMNAAGVRLQAALSVVIR